MLITLRRKVPVEVEIDDDIIRRFILKCESPISLVAIVNWALTQITADHIQEIRDFFLVHGTKTHRQNLDILDAVERWAKELQEIKGNDQAKSDGGLAWDETDGVPPTRPGPEE